MTVISTSTLIAVLVLLSSESLAQNGRFGDNPLNPERWGPGAIGGVLGGVVGSFLVISVSNSISNDIRKSAQLLQESETSLQKLSRRLGSNPGLHMKDASLVKKQMDLIDQQKQLIDKQMKG